MKRFAILMTLAVPLHMRAADPAVRGPASGFVLEAGTGSVRPVNGVAGASAIGAALDVPAVAALAASPGADWAIGVSRDNGSALLIRQGKASVLDFVPAGARLVAAAADGRSAVVVDPDNARATIVRGLPESPAGESADLSGLGGKVRAMALGKGVLLAATDEALWVSGAVPRRLADLKGPCSVALLEGDEDAVFSDAGAGTVTLVRDLAGAAAATVIAGPADGIVAPVGIAAVGRNIVVAQASGLILLPADGGPARALPCGCTVTELSPMSGGAAFRLNAAQPARLVDLGGGEPRLLWLP